MAALISLWRDWTEPAPAIDEPHPNALTRGSRGL
jgi:hypothetical protein